LATIVILSVAYRWEYRDFQPTNTRVQESLDKTTEAASTASEAVGAYAKALGSCRTAMSSDAEGGGGTSEGLAAITASPKSFATGMRLAKAEGEELNDWLVTLGDALKETAAGFER